MCNTFSRNEQFQFKNNSRHHTMKKKPLMFQKKRKKKEKKADKKETKGDCVFEKKEISDYFNSLSELEKKAFLIAQ